MTRLDGIARETVLATMTQPVLNCCNLIMDNHDDKISDPDMIPDEFKDYGQSVTAEMKEQEAYQKRLNILNYFVECYAKYIEPDENGAIYWASSAFSYDATTVLSSDKIKTDILIDVATYYEKIEIVKDAKSFGHDRLFGTLLMSLSAKHNDQLYDPGCDEPMSVHHLFPKKN